MVPNLEHHPNQICHENLMIFNQVMSVGSRDPQTSESDLTIREEQATTYAASAGF